MPLTVNIGLTLDDPKKVEKSITWISESGAPKNYSCHPTESCDILSPYIILAYSADILTKNYAYIADWQRYYFFKNPQILTGGRLALQLSVDPLMSWSNVIKNSEGIIVRASLAAPTLIPDNQYPLLTSQRIIKNAVFTNPNRYFTNPIESSFILTTLSGDYQPPTP